MVGFQLALAARTERTRESTDTMKTAVLWLVFISSGVFTGCWNRLYPPVAHVELLAPIYPASRPHDCNMMVLSAPPEQPYEPFAQIVSYAGSAEMAERMQSLIKREACQIGADAIVLLPMLEKEHVNTENTYPDWVLERGFGQGGRFPHWVDKRYAVSQRAFALVFKKDASAARRSPGL